MPDRRDYLTSHEALQWLGIKPQTLYAYVSRGWISSIPLGKGSRHLYSRADIERVKARADSRAGHEAVAAAAMRWGEPVISSSITEISADGPRYRGSLGTDLWRQGVGFETVAERLWSPSASAAAPEARFWPLVTTDWIADLIRHPALDPRVHPAHFLATVALLAGGGSLEHAEEIDAILDVARELVASLAASLRYLPQPPSAPVAKPETTIAERVAHTLGAPDGPETVAALDACLILCADHELSQTTFVARIAASAAANFGSCVSAAILSQPRLSNQRSPGRTEDFLWKLVEDADFRATLNAERVAGRNPPGFNHPLYPMGDPRGRALIEIAQGLAHQTHVSERLYHVFETAAAEFEFRPSFDAGLAAIRAALGLPRRSPGGLFVVGRSAGWIAHTLEQWAVATPLPPRARYVDAVYKE